MPRIKRKDVLKAIRIAGYHGDEEQGILLYVKNWVSREVYRREFEAGAALREQVAPCDCPDCTECNPGEASSVDCRGLPADCTEHESQIPVPT
jgi:hypothetical protein